MPCECRPLEAFPTALRHALHAFAGTSGAVSILRNGGAELALKATILPALEQQLDCVAITERQRVDLTLICQHCKKQWGHVEFKHNFVSQLDEVNARAEKGREQLNAINGDEHLFLIHIIVSLAGHPQSRLAPLHDAAVTSYKRFDANSAALLGNPGPWFHGEQPLVETTPIFDSWDHTVSARLHVWGQTRIAAGRWVFLT